MGDKHDANLDYPRGERSSRRQQMLQLQGLRSLQTQQQQQQQQQHSRQQQVSQPAKKARKEDDNTAHLRNMLMSFRVSELQMLLGFAGRNKSGRKTELQARAVELLRLRSEPVHMKIRELYKTIQESMGEAEGSSLSMYRQQGIAEQARLPAHGGMPHSSSAHGQSMHASHATHPSHSSHSSHVGHPGHSQHTSHAGTSLYQQPGVFNTQAQAMQQAAMQAQQWAGVPAGKLHSRIYPTMYPQSTRSLQPQPPVNSVHKVSNLVPVAPNLSGNVGMPGTYPVHPDVRLKKLPFYEMMGELLKPSSLMPQGSARMQENAFMFHLTPQQATDIAQHRDVGHSSKNEYLVQVQMRFCLLETSCDQDDCFPPSIMVKVNGKQCSLPNPIPTNRPGVEAKRPPRPVNISPLVKLSPTVANHITVSWGTDYSRGYVIAVHLVRKLSSTELLQKMKAKGVRHSDFTRGLIKEKLNDADAEIATTSLRVSLMCPLGKMRMTTPCRASTCIHLQCFDASLYLQMNERKPTWICPVCDKECLYDHLLIDGYFQDVLHSGKLPCDSHEIQLHPDGSWTTLVTVKKEQKVTPVSNVDKSETVEIIDDLEIIPADDTKPITKESPKKAPKAVVVDLTLSDSDDDGPTVSSLPSSSTSVSKTSTSGQSTVGGQAASSTPTRHYSEPTPGNSTPGPTSVSSSGYMSPTITLDDSPSPPSRPTPSATPSTSSLSLTTTTTSGSSTVPPGASSSGSGSSLAASSRGMVSPSYSSSIPYLNSVPYLDLESDSTSSQAGSTYPYRF